MKRNHTIRNLLLSALLATGAAAPALAQVSVNINFGPPAQQYESVPAVAPGHVWAPGYWAWHGDRYIWVRGHTIVQRPGYRWEPVRWQQRGNSYYQQPGHWSRDVNYRVVEVKKEKKHKKDKHWNDGRGNRNDKNYGDDKPGKGPKHDH